jgi:glutamyl-tRNA synthetase
MLFYSFEMKPLEDRSEQTLKALRQLRERFASVAWQRAELNNAIKDVVKSSGVKMPQLAMPLRLMVTGRTQTPSIDAVLELLGRETVMQRLARHLG